MTPAALALFPLTSFACYLALLALVLRRGVAPARARPFMLFLALMAVASALSASWRLSAGSAPEDWLLRGVEFAGMSAGAAFLILIQALYPSRWSRRARWIAAAAVMLIAGASLSGAINTVAIGTASPNGLQHLLFYPGVMVWPISYAVGFLYVAYVYRSHRDPFERNRLKYLGVAALLVALGSFTNVVPPLQELPVDQGINVIAATLIAFSILRYRLFDVDVAIKLGALRAATAVVVAPLYYFGVGLVFEPMRAQLLTSTGLAAAIGVGLLIGMVAPSIRGLIERLVDRLFVGGSIDHQRALFELNRVSSEVRGVDVLARETTELCQRTTATSVVALLLANDGELRLAAMSGPFARYQPEWTIRIENPLLQMMSEQAELTTPLMFERLVEDGAFLPEDIAEFGPYRDAVIAPIVSNTELVGCLIVGSKVYDAPFSLADLDLIRLVSGQSGVAIQNARSLERLRKQATTDFLTGLPNHRQLYEELSAVLEEAEADNGSLAVAMIDLDNFKLLNDVYGHQAGDDALRRIATTMRATARPGDIVGRYGGDEFLIIMPATTAQEAAALMGSVERRVRKVALVGDSPSKVLHHERLPARISWGVASYPQAGRTPRVLVAAADSQLLERRSQVRRTAEVHVERPTLARLLEDDQEKLRYARALLDIIDAKDPYTSEHSQQVASLSLLFARELGLSDRDRTALWLGGLLHDIGKIGTPRDVLRKPGPLSPGEWDQMREHPLLGESIARGLFDVREIVAIVGCHHERFDGTGYPRGLVGEEIPLLARATSIADAFSAMVHDRPYRKGLTWDEAVVDLYRHRGTQFDPELVDVFVRAIDRDQTERAA